MIFKWVFKSAAAILIVTNTWNIVMGVFDMAQSVVAQAAGIINSDASIDISSVMTDLEPRLMEMDLGPLFGLWFQSLFIGITMWALYICIFIVIYGRMIEIYLVTSVAPVPMAAMMGKEWGGMGQNYSFPEGVYFACGKSGVYYFNWFIIIFFIVFMFNGLATWAFIPASIAC